MNTVEAAKEISALVERAALDIQVAPALPANRSAFVPEREVKERADPLVRDASAGWTIFIEYVDSQGARSSRRITVLRFEKRVGHGLAIAALCHECGEYRLFRVERIEEIVDIVSGEIHTPRPYLERLVSEGLPVVNRGMHSFCRILAFIARCDGEFVRSEFDAIEQALTSYALRFGGETEDIDRTLSVVKNINPDRTDMKNALIAILRSPRIERHSTVRLLLRCLAAVIDADGRHMSEEIEWALVLRECLLIMNE